MRGMPPFALVLSNARRPRSGALVLCRPVGAFRARAVFQAPGKRLQRAPESAIFFPCCYFTTAVTRRTERAGVRRPRREAAPHGAFLLPRRCRMIIPCKKPANPPRCKAGGFSLLAEGSPYQNRSFARSFSLSACLRKIRLVHVSLSRMRCAEEVRPFPLWTGLAPERPAHHLPAAKRREQRPAGRPGKGPAEQRQAPRPRAAPSPCKKRCTADRSFSRPR